MTKQNIFIIILSVIVVINTLIISLLLFSSYDKGNRSTTSNVENQTLEESPNSPPETISLDSKDIIFGSVKRNDTSSIVISRSSDGTDEDLQYTIQLASGAIITDSMRTEIDVLRDSTKYELSEIPLDSTVSAQCSNISNNVCTATIVQFIPKSIPEGFNPTNSEQTP